MDYNCLWSSCSQSTLWSIKCLINSWHPKYQLQQMNLTCFNWLGLGISLLGLIKRFNIVNKVTSCQKNKKKAPYSSQETLWQWSKCVKFSEETKYIKLGNKLNVLSKMLLNRTATLQLSINSTSQCSALCRRNLTPFFLKKMMMMV